MLKKVNLKSVASYDEIGTEFYNLKKVNFIYGNNGCGKSTFSNYFYNSNNLKYSASSFEDSNNSEYLVYNKQFVEDNFKNELPGIFTLGKEHIHLQKDIDDIETQIAKNKKKIEEKTQIKLVSSEEIHSLVKTIESTIWQQKNDKNSKWHQIYQEVFSGYNASKSKFYNYFLKFSKWSYHEDESVLFEKATKILTTTLDKEDKIPFKFCEIEIDTNIFSRPIIGSKDVDIAELINQLHISDWVKDGKEIIETHDLNICPLCQNDIDEKITNKLNSYFNESYKNQLETLNREVAVFKDKYETIHNYLTKLEGNKYIGEDSTKLKMILENTCLTILQKFSDKISSPSSVINLDLSELNAIIYECRILAQYCNEKIEENNQLANNFQFEKEKIFKEVKSMFAQLLSPVTSSVLRQIEIDEKKVEKINAAVQNLNTENKKLISLKEKTLQDAMGINESVDNINKQLKSFGFENFELKEEIGSGKYSVVRSDGESANKTLSEGEKTFITFLYYYQKVVNELQKNNVYNKILIIDDPISSLDSTVMYIVSSLIKKLIKMIEQNKNYIKQIIVLTHNTYFYKEITYKISDKYNFANYYIIRKLNNVSKVYEYQTNPIRTSYEELWKELEAVKDTSSSIIQNIMRRILENYFSFLGDIKLQDLCDPFEESLKPLVSSLVMWTHDGSHSIQDDLFVEQSSDMNAKYYQIFREIFVKHNQELHFNMMLNKCFKEENRSIFKFVELSTA